MAWSIWDTWYFANSTCLLRNSNGNNTLKKKYSLHHIKPFVEKESKSKLCNLSSECDNFFFFFFFFFSPPQGREGHCSRGGYFLIAVTTLSQLYNSETRTLTNKAAARRNKLSAVLPGTWWGSNSEPLVYEASALPLHHYRI